MAAGRQGGIWQVWINGTRVYRANNFTNTINNTATFNNNITTSFNRLYVSQQSNNGRNNVKTFVVNDIRLATNVNIYGDSATITVPSLPLIAFLS